MDSKEQYISDKYLEDPDVKEFEKGSPLEVFNLTQENLESVSEQFQVLNQISMTRDHEFRLIPHLKGITAHLNRYSDILPYEYSAVKLDKGEDETANEYINANYIPTPYWNKFDLQIVTQSNCDEHDLDYIACQGPKSNTVDDFWRMVYQQNIGLIVMLCKLSEDGRPKCEQYWPDEGETSTYSKSGLSVTCNSIEDESKNIHHRTLTIQDTNTSESRTLKQIQYSGWPDHGVPKSSSAIEDFGNLIEYCLKESKRMHDEENGEKILFHCSAGIGRTGTLLTLIHLFNQIEHAVENETEIATIPVFSTLRRLREYRFHLVQTEVQYLFIYKYLSWYLKKIKVI